LQLAQGLPSDLRVSRPRQVLLPALPLLNYRFLNVDRDVQDVLDFEVFAEEGFHARFLILAEDVCDHESLGAHILIVVDVGRLVLLVVSLAQKFAHLRQEALVVLQQAPRLDAQNQVEPLLTP